MNRTENLSAQLRQQILDDTLPIGTKLPSESELISAHGVSRTVVREALTQLRAEGLIHTRRGTGSFVLAAPAETSPTSTPAPRTAQDRALLIEYRMALECEVAALAAVRRTQHQLAALAAALEGFAAAVEHPATAVEQDFAFHRTLAEAAGNPHLIEAVSRLGPTMISMPRTRLEASADRHQLAALEHRAILDAVREADSAAASAAMRLHLTASRRRVLELD
ncbi:FadR/GntR family transcriptional regulator [Nesterenkonia sandarakina]|uniref:GntR family transcriptional repressor for pyruvate dehydrogenase complex n=1 Tax=Nesterenkonia sandarakina TaxID=272918 RepID=A0A7Z0E813_9MICC|nr:FCD domain-containing protein [Nesterenkonia sandarakina]NYJ16315.1 GntR family transcriptional repressor for pyruvate dehydrogenase complex [Nesterenkonia sandarakina]